MVWVDIVGLLAVIQLMVFISLVGRARGQYNVPAPATTGHPVFERYFRVQMNTIECLFLLLPGLWVSAKYWPPKYVAVVGAVYLAGRMLYLRSYVSDPSSRSLGYGLSAGPAALLVFAALVGAVRAVLQH